MVSIKKYALPEPDREEILRYAGVRSYDGALFEVLERTLKMCERAYSPRLCYSKVPVVINGGVSVFPFASVESRDLAEYLSGCGEAVIFAATVGTGADRVIRRLESIDSAAALFADAAGSERIETLCDVFASELAKKYKVRPRFSPGYGDLGLGFQREIFRALECEKKIGLTLNGSLMMSPGKSVTALIGIEKDER